MPEHRFAPPVNVGTMPPMTIPLRPRADACAAIERVSETNSQWGGWCPRPVAIRARWRYADHTASLLLCDVHAAELAGDERLSHLVWFYDATAEDGQPA